MNNHATPETAWKLKNSGFPQPETNRHQIWYDTDKVPFEATEFSNLDSRYFAYAPTATDILKELGHEYSIRFYLKKFEARRIVSGRIINRYLHENPAEACALAYLDK